MTKFNELTSDLFSGHGSRPCIKNLYLP